MSGALGGFFLTHTVYYRSPCLGPHRRLWFLPRDAVQCRAWLWCLLTGMNLQEELQESIDTKFTNRLKKMSTFIINVC